MKLKLHHINLSTDKVDEMDAFYRDILGLETETQGLPLLEKNKGVCWAGINRAETVVVPNVHDFPGHIACDSRSNSEIVVPLKTKEGTVYGVLDIDSTELNSFDEVDARWLEKILELI